MHMKFNWGTGIFIFLILFFIAIFSFVYFAFMQEVDLVEDDYYPKELNYEQQINKRNNLKKLGEQIRITQLKNHLTMVFPPSQKYNKIKGEILIYRPSDSRSDLKYKIELDSTNSQTINASKFLNGKYIVKVDWSYHELEYYQELTIIL
jgi:hypothetical protein